MKKIITLAIIILCFSSMFAVACGKAEESNIDKSPSNVAEMKASYLDSEFMGEVGYIVENQLWDYSERFEIVYQWAEGVYLPFEKIEGGEIYFASESEVKNQGWLVIDGVSDEMLQSYISTVKNQGYSVWESDTSINIYKDGLMMLMVRDNEKVYPYVYTGNVKGDREVSLSDARNLIEEQGLLKDYEYFNEYCVIAIENASVREQGLYEFIIRSVRNDDSIYNWPYYLITDGDKILLFEQEIYTAVYPSTVHVFEGNLRMAYVKSEQGAGPSTYISEYALKNGVYEKKSEEKLGGVDTSEDMIVGKLENGEYRLYKLKNNEEAEFPIVRKNMWIIGEEYIP